MLIKNINCEAESTMNKNIVDGIYDLLEADWVAVITIDENLNIIYETITDIKNIGNSLVHNFLEEFKFNIKKIKQSYKIFSYNFSYFAIIYIKKSVLKIGDVFYVYCKKETPFDEKSVKWASLYSITSYEKFLLKNELTQDKNYLENVLNSTESAIIVFDLYKNIISVNSMGENWFDDNLDILKFENLNLEDRYTFLTQIDEVINTGKKRYLYKIHIVKSETDVIFNVIFSPLKDGKNNTIGVVAVGTDVTFKQVLEYEFDQVKKYGLLGEIALGLSHDVKNPLMNIRACASLLKRNKESDNSDIEILEIIMHEVDRINEIMEQMLSFGNVVKENDYILLNVNEILHNCIQIMKRQKMYKNIILECDFDDSIYFIQAKNSDIQQVFLNILMNSMQAIDESGTINIMSRYNYSEKEIEITISDDGKGIEEASVSKLFNPCYSTKPNGTGLGLFIVKKVLDQYSGKIKITSTPEIGTICKIYLPCANK